MNQQIKQRITQLNNGEIPDGYKKTEFGVFPCDWITDKTYGDLFDFYGGLSKSREELGEDGYPYLHYGDLHRGSFNSVSYEQYEKLPKCDVKLKGNDSFLMDDGDVAFLDASEDLEGTSRAVLIDNTEKKPFIAGLHIIYGKSKDERLAKWYKQYITSSESTKKQFQKLASGFKVYGLNRDTLAKIRIAYPSSRSEQEKIAEILMKWDEAIELQEKVVSSLDLRRHGLLQRAFSSQNCSLTIQLKNYIVEAKERNNSNCLNVMSISNMRGFVSQTEQFSKQVASEDVKSYKVVRKNYVAYNPSRINVGSIAIYQDDSVGIVSPMYNVFKCQGMNPYFLLLALQTSRGKYEIQSFLSGSVRDSLSLEDMKGIELRVPEEKQWESIVLLFQTIDRQIDLQKEQLDNLKKQRKALQQYLLNGIVRV